MHIQNLLKECIIIADRVLEIDPKDIDALLYKSHALINLQKYEECIISADKALAIDPNNKDVLILKNI